MRGLNSGRGRQCRRQLCRLHDIPQLNSNPILGRPPNHNLAVAHFEPNNQIRHIFTCYIATQLSDRLGRKIWQSGAPASSPALGTRQAQFNAPVSSLLCPFFPIPVTIVYLICVAVIIAVTAATLMAALWLRFQVGLGCSLIRRP